MADGEFNPNSYDAVLSSINTQLQAMNSTLTTMQNTEKENNSALHKKINEVETKIDNKIDTFNATLTKNITEVNNKVVALEYFRYYLAGMVTTASALGGAFFSYVFTKFLGGGGGGPTPPHV